ncbi:ATP synthase F1 subunit delta [bacterium]|nr:ATP synthase F1 subunit delta [bacterium]
MLSTVAKRYAVALFAAAQEAGRVEKIDAEAKVVARLFDDRQVRDFLTSPQIPVERKKDALRKQFGGRLDPLLVNLLQLLVDKKRIGELPQIMEHFDVLTDQSRGVEEATIVSAVPLSDEQRQAIEQQLKRFSAYGQLRINTVIDPALLGGVLVRLGRNLVLDGTLSSRMTALRSRLDRAVRQG